MDETAPFEAPIFMDTDRPDVPNTVVSRGVVPFYLPGLGVRGRLVRLGVLADALLTRRPAHPSVVRLTGSALALAAALATALKFRGSFSLQAKGDGPVSMLLADCTELGALRGYARVEEGGLSDDQVLGDAALLGAGYLAFTVEQASDAERHQGIVAIEGETLARMAEHYFRTSEQIPCAIHLACGHTESGWRASALILERVAAGGGTDAADRGDAAEAGDDDGERSWDEDLDDPDDARTEGWNTATILAATVTEAELLDDALEPEDLIYRLFNTETIHAGLARALAFGCRCSRAKLAGILETFPPDDLDHMAETDDIVMTCEFCNHAFHFPRAAVQGR